LDPREESLVYVRAEGSLRVEYGDEPSRDGRCVSSTLAKGFSSLLAEDAGKNEWTSAGEEGVNFGIGGRGEGNEEEWQGVHDKGEDEQRSAMEYAFEELCSPGGKEGVWER
jgi:hypothetical protein